MAAFLACDVGGTYTKVAVLEDGQQTFQTQFRTPQENSADRWWPVFFSQLQAVVKPKMILSVSGLGLALPVTFDYSTTDMYNSPNLRVLAGRNAKRDAQTHLPQSWKTVPLILMNDADAAGLGVAHEFKQTHCFLFTLGSGCGGALILNQKLWIGDNHHSSEVGHMALSQDPKRRCKCGKIGCVESFLGQFGLELTAKQLFPKKNLSKDHVGKALVTAAHEGDTEAQKILLEYGRHIGWAVASITNLLGIQSYFLYGGISQGHDVFAPGIQKGLQEGRFAFDPQNISVRPVPADPVSAGKNYAALGLYLCQDGISHN